MDDRISVSLQKIREELTANRKKAVGLLVLVLVLVFAVGRVFWARTSPVPAEAVLPPMTTVAPADPMAPQVRPVAQPPVPEASSGRPTTARPAAQAAAGVVSSNPGTTGERRRVLCVAVADLPRTLGRDIFTTPAWSQFPREDGSLGDEDQKALSTGPSLWEKMRDALSERRARRSQDQVQIAGELAELKLQSTMNGPWPAAYISGRLVHEGDAINGFSVVRIQEKCVKLRKNGITQPLIMP